MTRLELNPTSLLALALTLGVITLGACRSSNDTPSTRAEPASSTQVASTKKVVAVATPKTPPDPEQYPWLESKADDLPPAVDTLDQRIAPPRGFTRVKIDGNRFGAWLRTLPLAAEGTPVLRFDGRVLHPPGHDNVAAVAAIDIGSADLQQCADAIIRLHAEHKWSQGERDMSYTSASGVPLPYSKWARGGRVKPSGMSIHWAPSSAPADASHKAFRGYLDSVFAWTNTVALAKQAKPVKPEDIRPGDFFIQGGNPGHTVLVLDVAESSSGEKRMLLGQSFMPAQNFHVLRRSAAAGPWYPVNSERALKTPFWKPFQWDELERLD